VKEETAMSKLNQRNKTQWAWLLPILALSPLALAAKGCDNTGVVGNECPTAADCTGSAGKTSDPGTKPGDVCGGLLGKGCSSGQFCDFPQAAQCGAADQTGVCAAKPEACDLIYSPVCGCDDKTYGNDCAARSAGVSVASNGECSGNGSGGGTGTGGATGGGDTCGGILPSKCPADQYCSYPVTAQCGAADQTGQCVDKPSGCTKEYNPVCGCDDMTYGNPCMAAAAGVSVAAKGECKPTGNACGRVGPCADDEYCNFPPSSMCGIADGPGVCAKLPPKGSACDAVYAPVCGCDGKTYGNDCEAQVAGVSVKSEGECGSSGGQCGGIQGIPCEKGSFCQQPIDTCQVADGFGTCTVIPEVCNDIYDPVCGCDGTTYANDCEAAGKQAALAYKGACKK
jgi:hypothetical protein